MHEKKVLEQEKELQQMLNMRYGWGTWDELTHMRRQIKAKRERDVYRQAQRQAAFVETVQIIIAVALLLLLSGGLIYWIASVRGLV
jgi:hypothetical protein